MAEIKLNKRYKYAGDIFQKLIEIGFNIETATSLLNDIKDADVVEVRHGEWLDNYEKITTLGGNGVPKEYLCGYKCSLCGRTEIGKEPYCNCGAKMDGGKAE